MFVFISDYKVPFVPSDKDYDVVFISEGVQVVIPCRGSVENLNVTLHTVRTDSLTLLSIWADILRHTKVELTSQKVSPENGSLGHILYVQICALHHCSLSLCCVCILLAVTQMAGLIG